MTNSGIIKNICVFASASNELNNIYCETAKELGKILAKEGYDIVYGGSRRGLMYICAENAKKNGSKIYGVMPEKLADMGFANPEDCNEFYITKGMRERKSKLDELSDASITIPGGFGTLEEVSEMIVQKQLGYNFKPIIILNTNGFYNDLLKFFNRITEENFAYKNYNELFYVANSPKDVIEYLKTYKPNKNLYKFARL